MKQKILITCLLCVLTGCAGARAEKQAEPDARTALERQILTGLEMQLKKLFSEAGVQAVIRNEGNRLAAGFKIGGEASEGSQTFDSTTDPTTPERNEFRMQVTIIERLERWITGMSTGYKDTIHRQDAIPIQWTEVLALLVIQDYGRDVDFDLIKKINAAIEDYADKRE